MTAGPGNRLTGADSFTRFYTEWYWKGVGFASRACGLNHHDAQEVSSDAMKAVHAVWGGLDRPEAYFQHVVRMRAIDQYRRTSKERVVSDEEVETLSNRLAGEANHAFPESVYADRETVLTVLTGLPPQLRMSLVLQSQGYTAAERAKIKQVPVETERTHLARARRLAVELLADAGSSPRHKEQSDRGNLRRKEGDEK
ncbi:MULTISPECIES: RNA polymerase sigma factor [unclassified Streptomyces]|uniref:RNA polymerase sigma factor n=1 Tax=unclassified Streptomyces TaxID=2593676 RepID=UPI0029BC20E8|nr:hypothetical protein [Streptomyces sp. DK15]MDX2395271.1 hypothetical protein [Streptomyces sp. DK15]